MNAFDGRRSVSVFLLEAENQQQAEDDRNKAHMRQANAPVSCAFQAPSIISRADISTDGVERHHESIEHSARSREDWAGHRVHDDVPASFEDTKADTPESRSDEASRSRDTGRHAAETDHAENQHALAAETVSQITCGNIDECLSKGEDRANCAELYSSQRQRGSNCLKANAEG